MRKVWWLCVAVSLLDQVMLAWSQLASPPLPVLPIPSVTQLKWQRREIIMFFHFGMNTFTDSEWGTGHESPSSFNPTNLDANQWVGAAADIGVSLVILTAKHHDGFCLWPSTYTDHTVEKSPWKGGKGDIVREFVDAAKARGVDVGLYLSPWDRHERSYGQDLQYNEFYIAQLQELLTRYGSISEIWFDGAKGADAANMTYYFNDWFSMVKQLQNSINIFSDAGPDVRWVGDESGFAGSTCWSPINRTMLTIGSASIVNYLNKGDPRGTDWVPPECDVSIRPGWFWHKPEAPKSLSKLLEIYYKSVGRNCVLLLNVPPNSTGLLSETDIKRLKEFHSAIYTIFSNNLTKGSKVKASSQRGGQRGGFSAENVLNDDELSYWAPEDTDGESWIEMKLSDNGVISFNVIRIQEAIWMGQRIKNHEVYADDKVVAQGMTVGYKRLHRLGKIIQARSVRIRITNSRGVPLLSSVGLHLDPFAASSNRI
ncbi:alpha-L-fucosidase 1-like [Dioscorea cayenensis subsp. rotundata]|uniref:alpha-L-fucosidase n=1 Tax=Dioscorea cayennensis subsp. rotundata TaxID=55577 RepID=A0AB40CGU8_DIOCR|nr:alpha-L-fucosidase 1-like [Dioscorea cayenensis subsp. rotundata]